MLLGEKITRILTLALNHLERRLRASPKSADQGYFALSQDERIALGERLSSLSKVHRFSVVMPAYKTPPELLRAAMSSVLDQFLSPHELIVVDDSGPTHSVVATCERLKLGAPPARVLQNEVNLGISGATNVGVAAATGDFIFFIDHDDELTVDALLSFAECMEKDPEADVWYSDQYTIDERGSLKHHFLKPDWSPIYALGAMYPGHLLAVRRELCQHVQFRSEFNGVQDFEFLLRVSEESSKIGHVRAAVYKWRAVEGSLALGTNEKSDIDHLQSRAVNEHLVRMGRSWRADSHPALPHRILLRPSRRTREPQVSIVIPSRNQGAVVERCLSSLFALTDYTDFEVVLVDNRTTDPVALEQFKRFPVRRVLYDVNTFNYSEANNIGVRHAGAELLLFLNNDTEIIDSDWLRKLAMFFEDPGVGAVGATLLYPDRTIQHAGVILGPRGTADHVMRGFSAGQDGYGGSLAVAREVTAVTAACLMMPKQLFLDLGGFSTDYAKHYQDVDLCLKVRHSGRRVISAGDVSLIHHESLTRKSEGYDFGDRAILLDRWWRDIEAGDPYYNPGFEPGSVNYSLKQGWLSH